MLADKEIEQFREGLLKWFAAYKRDLPWRRRNDPYGIWISEVMLQQTRVGAAVPFYERFLERFPDVKALAEASETDLLAHWAGLGYYYRARNLQKAAQQICQFGAFPATREAIRALPGVGEYTSAAVASIAFGLPVAAVDGNVLRVLARVLGDGSNIGSTAGRKHFSQQADRLLDRAQAGDYNQATMELGATICLPRNPQCLVCPVASVCRARQSGRQNELPVKLGRAKCVREERVLFWIERSAELLMWQRPASARLMPGFWELPERMQLPQASAGEILASFRHAITFHDYRFELRKAEAPEEVGECQWIPLDSLRRIPISTIARKAIHRVVTGQQKNLKAHTAVPMG